VSFRSGTRSPPSSFGRHTVGHAFSSYGLVFASPKKYAVDGINLVSRLGWEAVREHAIDGYCREDGHDPDETAAPCHEQAMVGRQLPCDGVHRSLHTVLGKLFRAQRQSKVMDGEFR
jgi:hypothetical protein